MSAPVEVSNGRGVAVASSEALAPPPQWYLDRGPLPLPFLCEVLLGRLPADLARIHRDCRRWDTSGKDGPRWVYRFLAHDIEGASGADPEPYSLRYERPRILVCQACEETILVGLKLL